MAKPKIQLAVQTDDDLVADLRAAMNKAAGIMGKLKARQITVVLNIAPNDDGTFKVTDTIQRITPL